MQVTRAGGVKERGWRVPARAREPRFSCETRGTKAERHSHLRYSTSPRADEQATYVETNGVLSNHSIC
jgi:hypothetical protein